MPKKLNKPKVGHVKNKKDYDHTIKCDRTSALGNPFELDKSKVSSRSQVIEGFRRYLYLVDTKKKEPTEAADIVSISLGLVISKTWARPRRVELMQLLGRIRVLSKKEPTVLLCWCFPLPCHCDVIANYVEYKNKHT